MSHSLFQGNNQIVYNNIITNNAAAGQDLFLHTVTNSLLTGNYISSNPNCRGIYIYAGSGNIVENNEVIGGGQGVYIQSTSNTTLRQNNITGASLGLYLSTPGTMNIYNNNIDGNINKEVIELSGSIELSSGGIGNYWGRTSSPYFIAGTDSNAAGVVDSNPLSSAFPFSRTGLVAHYELDESSGSILDSSDNSYTGTYNGALYSNTGAIGTSLGFDGVNDFVAISSPGDFDYSTGSISLWFKTNTTSYQSLFGFGDEAENYGTIYIGDMTGNYADESLTFITKYANDIKIFANVREGHTAYADGEWHHVVVVVGLDYNEIYVDGVDKTLSYPSGDGSSSTGNYFMNVQNLDVVGIGTTYPSPQHYFTGDIDEVQIYKYPVSSSTVMDLYLDGSGGCLIDGDCASGEFCDSGDCTSTCSTDGQCPSGYHCDSTCTADVSNGGTCDEASDCTSNNCESDLDTSGSICTATTSCNYLDTERVNTYSTCYSNNDYTCNSGTWGSIDCSSTCGYYPSIDTCSGSSCVACTSSCTVDGNCDSNAHCDSNECLADLSTGSICDESSDCTSTYCVDDYDTGQFCSDDSTSCQHDNVDYNNGATSGGYTCQSGVWNDITAPSGLTISNVDGDSSSAYWDTSNNAATVLQLTGGEAGIACRASTTNTNYDAMGSYVECSGSTTVSCSLSLTQSSSYTYYIACEDAAGNDQTGGSIESVSFGVDWSDPTTYVSGYGSVYVPGHTVTINEADNIGNSVSITTYECHPTNGCSPTTVIDHSDTVSFSGRGDNYVRWYSTDAAGNSQNVSEAIVTINSLPVVQDVGYVLGGYTGKVTNSVTFFCDGTDSNSAVDNSFSAEVYIRTTGSGTWNKVNAGSMTYNGGSHDFTYDFAINEGYPTSYDVACVMTDDLGEDSTQYSENSVFTVVNSAPIVDDITIQSNVSKYDTMRIYCDGSDPDGLAESALTATLYMKTDNAAYPPWNRIDGEVMLWDGTNHYYDYLITDDGGTEYDVRCILADASTSGIRDEFKFESDGFVSIVDDWDNDGVTDSTDTLGGSASDINTTLTLDVLIDGLVLNDTTGVKMMSFKDQADNVTLIEFDHDFSDELLLSNITVERVKTGRGSLLIRGLSGKNKTVKMDKVLSTGKVCIKNQEVNSVNEISSSCQGVNEILFDDCSISGQTTSGITCTDKGTYYEIAGLTNSATIEFGQSSLEIFDTGNDYINVDKQFIANYSNVTSGAAIGDGSCDIYFDDWDNWTDMTFSNSLHTLNRSFSVVTLYTYNVSCVSATYDDLTVSDSVYISDPTAVPEWSDLAYVLIIVGALGAMYSRRE